MAIQEAFDDMNKAGRLRLSNQILKKKNADLLTSQLLFWVQFNPQKSKTHDWVYAERFRIQLI